MKMIHYHHPLDKTIKLWKVFEKSIKVVSENNLGDRMSAPPPLSKELLKMPKMIYHDSITAAIPRKIYQNAHGYHINSISVNSDGETYISADDLRINLWNLDISDQSFSMLLAMTLSLTSFSILILDIVDIKPVNMEELTEVITCAEFHPTNCNMFVYCSSKGIIRLNDMRMNALCDNRAKGLWFFWLICIIPVSNPLHL